MIEEENAHKSNIQHTEFGFLHVSKAVKAVSCVNKLSICAE